MVWRHREVVSKPDYLLATKNQKLSNVMVREPCQNSNHFMYLGCILTCPLKENKIYLGSMWHFPLNPQEMARSTRADTLFVALREAIPHLYPRNFPRNTWILQKNWSLIYQNSVGHRYPIMYQLQLRCLSQRVRYNLRAYWAQRVKVTGE